MGSDATDAREVSMPSNSIRSPRYELLHVVLLYAVWRLVRDRPGPPGRVRAGRAALASELRCPNGHANDAVGALRVRRKPRHLPRLGRGWVGACALCGAGAGCRSPSPGSAGGQRPAGVPEQPRRLLARRSAHPEGREALRGEGACPEPEYHPQRLPQPPGIQPRHQVPAPVQAFEESLARGDHGPTVQGGPVGRSL